MQATVFALAMIVAAFLTAFAALLAFSMIDRRRTSQLRRFTDQERDAVVFIFEDEKLLNATPAARQLLDSAPRHGTVWDHLAEILAPRFPLLTDRMHDLADLGELDLRSVDGSGRLHAEWHDGVARITLDPGDGDPVPAGFDRHSYLAMSQELESLRAMAGHTPYALWRETASGNITWCNAAYLAFADQLNANGDPSSWPPMRVFDTNENTLTSPGGESAPDLHRVAIGHGGDDTRHWFDVSVSLLPGGDRFCSALPADRLVEAESTHRDFVTTLTKTFAALPIGLAIFDHSRELALFNPALMDLTLLPAEFLISRPSLSSVLDRLREARMMPEPKDYKSWRQQMSDLVAEAQNGSYEETWTLPTGQTYRVTGQPHPGGAVALLFEDISAEISVSRRFRTEIDTGQAVLDALPQAIAVFTPNGVLAMSNAAYGTLWARDPATTLHDITLDDALRGWRASSAPNPLWDHLRVFAGQHGPRNAWRANVTRHDGRTLGCTVSPLAGGGMMVAFAPADPKADTGPADPTEPRIEAHVGF